MRTYKFIKNSKGEVVSVDKITAVTFDHTRAPYEMRVYTPMTKYGIAFHYDTTEKMWRALNNLDKIMGVTRLRIIKFANWLFTADSVESISDCAHGLRVRMDDGQNFDIMIESKEEIEVLKKEIEESLVSMYSMKDLDVDDDE
jgi:hypothetical protein